MIEVSHLSKSFDSHVVLEDISTVFRPGQVNLVIGQSGSGKTVLLKSLVGLLPIEQGDIIYSDQSLKAMTPAHRKDLRRRIGMLFQGSALFDSMTVLENVMFPLDMFTSWSRAEKAERAQACLERVELPSAAGLFPSELSGGMKKRVAIARAIAPNPDYLFCDEPNSGLDPLTSIVIDDLIREITHEYGITTVVNTHDMNSVMGIGENIIFIYQGMAAWNGNKDQIMTSTNQKLNDFIFASDLFKKVKEEEMKEDERLKMKD